MENGLDQPGRQVADEPLDPGPHDRLDQPEVTVRERPAAQHGERGGGDRQDPGDPVGPEARLDRGALDEPRPQLPAQPPGRRLPGRQMAAGRSDTAIGEALYLSVPAVEKHISAIFTKLGLVEERSSHRRVAAVLAYLSDR